MIFGEKGGKTTAPQPMVRRGSPFAGMVPWKECTMLVSVRVQFVLAITVLATWLMPTECFGQYDYRAMFPRPDSPSSYPLPRVHPPMKAELMDVRYPQPVHRDRSAYPALNVPPWAVAPPPPINLDRYPPVTRSPELVRQPRFPLIHWLLHDDGAGKHSASRISRQP